MTVRVLLVDAPEPARAVAERLADEASLEVVEQAGSVAEALDSVSRHAADVALLATRLPDGNGLELCRELRSQAPGLRCLLLTSRADDDTLFDAIMAGAAGVAPRYGADLAESLRLAASGGPVLDRRTTFALLGRLRRERETRDPLAGLTYQERAVLGLIGEGLSNRRIAAALRIADKVVKTHVSHLMGKLGLSRRTQLVEFAARLGKTGGPPEAAG
ncbi:MAG: response regulator [Actinophytocola sp.]|uniref:response regulator n=1 Tax=Actinophytocola sp. TaxID=1872138 RepID=UPI003D6A6C68